MPRYVQIQCFEDLGCEYFPRMSPKLSYLDIEAAQEK